MSRFRQNTDRLWVGKPYTIVLGSPPQPPLCRLRPAIWLYHGNIVCQYLFCTIHHAATLRTLSPIVQPLLWNQCDSNGYLFSNIDKIAYYGTGFIYRKPGHVVSICAVNGVLASGLWFLDLRVIDLRSTLHDWHDFTASNTLAMECERRNAGIASALLGATGFAFGGIVSPLVSLGDMMTSTGILFLAGSVCTYACTRYVLSRSAQPSGLLYHWKLSHSNIFSWQTSKGSSKSNTTYRR